MHVTLRAELPETGKRDDRQQTRMTKPALEKFPLSERITQMQASSTLAAMQKAQALRASGVDVVDLGAGEPDFDTPEHIKLAATEAMHAGETKYTATGGTRPLQTAIINHYEREEIVKFAGAQPVFIETEETGFQLTAEQVRRAITPRTKLIIINSPSNPSGRVIPPAEFRRIMEVVAEHGIYAVSDECYLRFVYPPAEVFSAATLAPELRARLCIAGSFSKTYAMTGWRMGYALAPREWTKAMLLVQGHSTSNPNSIAQRAATEAFNNSQDCVSAMLAEYSARREWLVAALAGIPGLSCFAPEGAFYAFPNVRGCLRGKVKTSADFAEKLLNDEQTVVTDGAGFGADGYIRISYATSLERLQEGVRRIRRVAEACAR